MGVIKFILFFVVFYYIFKFIGKVLFPMFISNQINKMNNHQQGQSDFINQQKKQEGKVTIRKESKSQKNTPDDLGEYVDFEEVKE